eukprot:1154238-Pelagomonas_calceolata.AAC.1
MGGNQYSIRSAQCEPRPLIKIVWKGIRGYNSVRCMYRDLKVVLCQSNQLEHASLQATLWLGKEARGLSVSVCSRRVYGVQNDESCKLK